MTNVAGIVALIIIYEGILFDGLIDNDEKVASSKTHTQFKTRVKKTYPVYDQNGKNRYQKVKRPYPLGRTYVAT